MSLFVIMMMRPRLNKGGRYALSSKIRVRTGSTVWLRPDKISNIVGRNKRLKRERDVVRMLKCEHDDDVTYRVTALPWYARFNSRVFVCIHGHHCVAYDSELIRDKL